MPKLLDLAVKIAGKSRHNKSFYFCAIAKRTDGKIVISVNHDIHGQKVPEHHAEARVIRKCDRGAVLYIARVLRADKKTWANAKPCPRCQAFIKNSGIKKAFYTIGPNEWGVWES